MKIQYNGDKWKLIPLRYKEIKDIGRFFQTEKRRLTLDERVLLNQELLLMKFRPLWELWVEELKSSVRKIIIEKPTILKIEYVAMIKTRERIYYVLRMLNSPEIECEEKMYRLACKISKINTTVITRVY